MKGHIYLSDRQKFISESFFCRRNWPEMFDPTIVLED
jgi:hypothetical protein